MAAPTPGEIFGVKGRAAGGAKSPGEIFGAPAGGTPGLALAAPPHHGGGGFLGIGGALHKVEGYARGVLPGVAALGTAAYDDLAGNSKPISKIGGQVAKSEAKSWGDFAYTGKPNVGVALDAASLLTGGGGAVGKLGDALRAGGVETDLGRAADLTAPDFAARVGQKGEQVVLKQSSANPVTKAAQVATNKALNKLPHQTPVVGSDARIVKALAKTPQRDAARVAVAAQPSAVAFNKLTLPERVAWHLRGQGVTPAQYKDLLLGQKNPSPAMLGLLDHPKVAQLVEQPSPRLQAALAEGRAASDHLTQLKVAAGHVTEQAAAESPYRLLRLVNGAKVVEPTPALLGAPSKQLVAARAYAERLQGVHDRAVARAGEKATPYPNVHTTPRGVEVPANPPNAGIAGVDLAQLDERIARTEARAAQTPIDARDQHEINGAKRQATTLRGIRDAATKRGGRTPGVPSAMPARGATTPTTERLGSALSVARDRVASLEARAAAKVGPTGYIDQPGREIPALAHELAAKGWEQPFYIPHSADTGGVRGLFTNRPASGFAAPAASGASKQNLGVLASQGKLAFTQNPIAKEYAKFKAFTEAQGLHDALVQHAAELPDGAPLPRSYEFLKVNRGEASAPYTQRIGGEFEHGLDPGFAGRTFTQDAKDADILRNAEGKRLVVPSRVKQIVESRQASVPHTMAGLAYQHLTSVWKHMVLGLRPAFFGNITAGNSLLGLLQAAPRHGFTSWLNQVAPGLERALGSRVTDETMRDVFPEQALGTFGHTSGFGSRTVGTSLLGRKAASVTMSKAARGASHVYQGVMPATIAYENLLRRAMVEGWAKASPEVRAAMAFPGNGLASHGDINAALRQVAETHPQVINNISKRVDDALGDYRNYNRLERQIKNLIPFYGWDRHIVRSTARLARERPGRLDALAKVGQIGQQQNNATLGPLPSYLQGGVRLPGLPSFMGPLGGRTAMLVDPSLNPFSTDADLLGVPAALTGQAGGVGSETLSSGLNPVIQALIEQATGKSLLSGAPVKGNAFLNTVENIPQASLIRALIGKGTPTKPTSLYANSFATLLAAYLGAPVKKANLQTAHLYAAEEGKPRP